MKLIIFTLSIHIIFTLSFEFTDNQRQSIWTSFSSVTDSNVDDWDHSGGIEVITSNRCPSTSTCLRYEKDDWLWRVDSTEGYHSIQLLYSVRPIELNSNDYCESMYGSNNIDMTTISQDATLDTKTVSLHADNNPIVTIAFLGPNEGDGRCYLDSVYLSGIPITVSPTQVPVNPTSSPTLFPTKYPSVVPTLSPTSFPSVSPTHPTSSPSSFPTLSPTQYPSTAHVSMTPTYSPHTLEPTMIPTLAPSTAQSSQTPTLPTTAQPTLNIIILSPTVSQQVIESTINYGSDKNKASSVDVQSFFGSTNLMLFIGVFALGLIAFVLCCVFIGLCMKCISKIRKDTKQLTHVAGDNHNGNAKSRSKHSMEMLSSTNVNTSYAEDGGNEVEGNVTTGDPEIEDDYKEEVRSEMAMDGDGNSDDEALLVSDKKGTGKLFIMQDISDDSDDDVIMGMDTLQ